MISALLNIPITPDDWLRFSYDNRSQHDAIRDAVRAQYEGYDLPSYVIDPIVPEALAGFLEKHQQMHSEMNGVLKLQSTDLQDVDFNKPEQLEAWIYLHYEQHRAAALKLGI